MVLKVLKNYKRVLFSFYFHLVNYWEQNKVQSAGMNLCLFPQHQTHVGEKDPTMGRLAKKSFASWPEKVEPTKKMQSS